MDPHIDRRRLLQLVGMGAVATVPARTAASPPGVRHNVGTRSRRAERAAREAADAVHRVLDFGDRGTTVSGRFPEEALEALERRPDVKYIEADDQYAAIGEALPWGVDRVDADVVHDAGETGGDGTDGEGGADVAIIDSGIDDDHPDLAANLGDGVAYADCSGTDCTDDWSDDHGHGTHCAGVAGAVDNTEGTLGVAPGVTLHAVKVLAEDGRGYYSDIAAGIEWVADEGHDVASLSLGGTFSSSTLRDACRYAEDNGVLVVAAAGNEGPCSDCVLYPARYDAALAVSATDSGDDLASFSSTGPEIELAAPGEYIYSTVPGGYESWSGTSMACPHVSGAGAQLMDNGLSSAEARTALRDTAEDIGLGGNEQGAGLLDVKASLDGTGGTELAVSTDAASAVDETTATLEGTLGSLGGASSASVGFEYRQTGSSTWSATPTDSRSSTGAFSESVSGLDGGTDYEFRAVADASDGDTDTGTTVQFSTASADTSVVVSTTGTSDVTESAATFEGSLDDLGGADSAEASFEYRQTGASSWATTAGTTLSSAGSFSATVSDLASGTDYELRAVADASDGDSDTGSTVGFSTDTAESALAISTSGPTGVSETSATLEGSLDEFGVATSVAVGFEYRESGTSTWAATATETLSATGGYSRTVDGLSSGTDYEVRAVADGSDGDTDTGSSVSFTTDSSGGTSPAIDTWSATTADSPNPHAEITVDWAVSDVDGDLSSLTSDVEGGPSTTSTAGGGSDSGTHQHTIKHGGGQSYTVTLTVTDETDRSSTDSTTVTSSGGGGRGN